MKKFSVYIRTSGNLPKTLKKFTKATLRKITKIYVFGATSKILGLIVYTNFNQ